MDPKVQQSSSSPPDTDTEDATATFQKPSTNASSDSESPRSYHSTRSVFSTESSGSYHSSKEFFSMEDPAEVSELTDSREVDGIKSDRNHPREESKRYSDNAASSKYRSRSKDNKSRRDPVNLAHAEQKMRAFENEMIQCLKDYRKILIVGLDGVGSAQMDAIRKDLKGDSVLLTAGSNNEMERIISEHSKTTNNEDLLKLLPLLKGNVGCIFTKGDVDQVRKKAERKSLAPARVGMIAPSDVVVPPGDTRLDQSETHFFKELNIPTKITVWGKIIVINQVVLIKKGDRVGRSKAALLCKLRSTAFTTSLVVRAVYDDGSLTPLGIPPPVAPSGHAAPVAAASGDPPVAPPAAAAISDPPNAPPAAAAIGDPPIAPPAAAAIGDPPNAPPAAAAIDDPSIAPPAAAAIGDPPNAPPAAAAIDDPPIALPAAAARCPLEAQFEADTGIPNYLGFLEEQEDNIPNL